MTILTSISRIVIIDNRYYPQIKINDKWTKVLSNKWDGRWYIPPKGFTGFQGIRNAEITLEWCEERIKMENRRYIINNAKKNMEKKKIPTWVIVTVIITFLMVGIIATSCAPRGDTRQKTEQI